MATKQARTRDWEDPENEAVSNFASFALEGDFVYGALLAPRREIPNKLSEKGGNQWLYEMKVHEASFHRLDKKKKVIPEVEEPEEGSTIIIGGKAGFDHKLARLKVGQLFGLKFTEELEPKVSGYNPTKVFKVYLPKNKKTGEFLMDESVLEAEADDEEKF